MVKENSFTVPVVLNHWGLLQLLDGDGVGLKQNLYFALHILHTLKSGILLSNSKVPGCQTWTPIIFSGQLKLEFSTSAEPD